MASIQFIGASGNMFAIDSWTAVTVNTHDTIRGTQYSLLDEPLSGNDNPSNEVVTRLSRGADGAIALTDSAIYSSGNVYLVDVYSADAERRPADDLSPYAYRIDDFSMPYGQFMAYFTSGNQPQFVSELLTGNDSITGSDYNDILIGYAGDDRIEGDIVAWGLGGNDTLWGFAGSDTLEGGAGNDSLIGDGGGAQDIDYALYSATELQDYSITQNTTTGYWVVSQSSNAPDRMWTGTDTLTGVERIIFSDTNVALDIDANPGMAYRIYKAAFDRAPDLSGLGFWINSLDIGQTGLQMAQGFVNSDEFLQMYGANSTNADFVDRLYLNVLDRPGETEGRNFWINSLNNGASRAAILLEFSESPENMANVAPLIEHGIQYTAYVS